MILLESKIFNLMEGFRNVNNNNNKQSFNIYFYKKFFFIHIYIYRNFKQIKKQYFTFNKHLNE